MIILSKVGLIKRHSINEFSGANVKFELDLPNYITKTDLKNGTGVDTSKIPKNVDLANLRSNVDKLDIGKLKNIRAPLSKEELLSVMMWCSVDL